MFLVTVLFCSLKLNYANKKIKMYDEQCNVLKTSRKNYLASLMEKSIRYPSSNIRLATGDTVAIKNIANGSLLFMFKHNECMTCIDENILKLVELSKENSSFNIYIISTLERENYLKLMSRVYDTESINFGILCETSQINKTTYFIKYADGVNSNNYYPIKGDITSTELYLEKVKNTISE